MYNVFILDEFIERKYFPGLKSFFIEKEFFTDNTLLNAEIIDNTDNNNIVLNELSK